MSAYQWDNDRPGTARERRRRAQCRRQRKCPDCGARVMETNPRTMRPFQCCAECREVHRQAAKSWRLKKLEREGTTLTS